MIEEKKYVCEYCGKDDFEDHRQFNGHRMACMNKNKKEEPEEERTERGEKRTKRIPFGSPEQKLGAKMEPGFHYRWFNDNWRKEPGRIQRAKAAGYEVVDHEKSGMTVSTNEDGSEVKAVLMRIPEKWHKEDQERKARELDKIDEQIHGGKFDKNLTNTYGDVKIETKINT
jgi:hypothetical protein